MDNILLITVDSLRADHVGWHGYGRETTPFLDEFAKDCQVFSRTFSHGCGTRASFPAILTSSYPLMYGGFERISKERELISETLSKAGYQTAGFHSNLYLGADFDYDRGFGEFFDSKSDPSPTARIRQGVKSRLTKGGFAYESLARIFNIAERKAGANIGSAYVLADEITNLALDWAASANSDQPKFLWVHYMDVHHPYVPPEREQRELRDEVISDRRSIRLRRKMIQEPQDVTGDELSEIIDLYDAEIRYADSQIGRLIEGVNEVWSGETITAVTADHGEEFREHGQFSHYPTFHDEVLQVPLLLNIPSLDGGRYQELVGLLDLTPTLVDYGSGKQSDEFYGNSLRTLIGDGDWDRTEIIASWENGDDRRFAYRDKNWKFIRSGNDESLYDLQNDPHEKENLINSNHSNAARLRQAVDIHINKVDATKTVLGEVEMDENVKKRLRSLGYRE
jgi:arylsulfatase A-like enzyme